MSRRAEGAAAAEQFFNPITPARALQFRETLATKIDKLPADALDALTASLTAYKYGDENEEERNRLKPRDYTVVDSNNVFTIFRKGDAATPDARYIVSFKGNEGVEQFGTAVELMLEGSDAAKFVRQVDSNYDKLSEMTDGGKRILSRPVLFTGHSMGGSIALHTYRKAIDANKEAFYSAQIFSPYEFAMHERGYEERGQTVVTDALAKLKAMFVGDTQLIDGDKVKAYVMADDNLSDNYLTTQENVKVVDYEGLKNVLKAGGFRPHPLHALGGPSASHAIEAFVWNQNVQNLYEKEGSQGTIVEAAEALADAVVDRAPGLSGDNPRKHILSLRELDAVEEDITNVEEFEVEGDTPEVGSGEPQVVEGERNLAEETTAAQEPTAGAAEAEETKEPTAGAEEPTAEAAAAVVDEDKSATPTGEGGPDPLDLTARYGPDMGGVGGGSPGSGTFGYSVRPGLRAAVNAQFHRYGKNFRTAVSEFGASKRYLDMKAETGGDGHQSLDRLLANYGSIVGIGALDHRQLDDAAMSSLYLEVGTIVDWFLRNPERLVARSVNNLASVLRSGGAAGGGAAQVLGGGFGGVSSVKEFAQALMRGTPAMVEFDPTATLGDAAGIIAGQGKSDTPDAAEAGGDGSGQRAPAAGTGPGNRRRLAANGSYTRHIDPGLRAQGVDRNHPDAGTGAVAGEVHPSGAATGDAFEAPELVAEHDRTQRANPGVITREGEGTFRLDTTKFRDSTGGTATRYDVALPYDGGGYKLAFAAADDDDDEAPVLDFPYPEVTGLMPANYMSQSVAHLKAMNTQSVGRVRGGNPV